MAPTPRTKRVLLTCLIGSIAGPIVVVFVLQVLTDGFEDSGLVPATVIFSIYISVLLAMFGPALVHWYRLPYIQVQSTVFLFVTIVLAHVIGLVGLAVSESALVLTAYPCAAAIALLLAPSRPGSG